MRPFLRDVPIQYKFPFYVAGWMGRTEIEEGTQQIGPMLLHWIGEEWRYVDVPLTGSGMFLDISEGYPSAWLVGRAGGTYDDNGDLSGDRPLIVAGTC